jgi:hypothetical protein
MIPTDPPPSLQSYLSSEHPGQLYFGGARMVLLDIEASFWGIRRQMEALAGRQLADSVLQQAGANGGASFARSFVSSTPSEDTARQFRECVAAYQAAGFGCFDIVDLEWPLGRILVKCQPGQIELDITDDGIGFDDSTSSPENLGLGIMVERAENIGAKLRISSQIDHGTQISVLWIGEPSTNHNAS